MRRMLAALVAPVVLSVLFAIVMHQVAVRRTARHLDATSTPLSDPRLEAVFARLARALELPALRVHVYETDAINGLAAPDGRIFLTRGLLRRHAAGAFTAEELASVVAHELGHVALGHSRRRMIDFTGQNAIRTALALILGRFVPIVGVALANLIVGALGAHLSRRDEYEADAYAAALMTKAGLGAEPQASLLAKLDRTAGLGGGPPVWLASHPPSADRIAAIRRLTQGWAGRA
jgi:putative metalloprotease